MHLATRVVPALAVTAGLLLGVCAAAPAPAPAPASTAPHAAKSGAPAKSATPKAAAPAAEPAYQDLPPGISPEAERLLTGVGESYANCTSYQFEGNSHMTMSAQGQQQSLDVPFRLAAVKPSKVLAEILNPAMSSVTVSDGSQTWAYAPQAGQYTHTTTAPLGEAGATNAQAGAMFATGTPIQRYVAPREGLLAARLNGEATLQLNGKPVRCTIVQAQYAVPDSVKLRMSPNTMWMDPVTHLVVRDSMSVFLVGRGDVPVRLSTVTDYRVARINGPVADSLFAFTPPAGARLVDRIDTQGSAAPVSPLVGQPAPDFTLDDVAGKRQRLSALRGKVVLLDFWATWCGPCRREMPTIVKLHRELASRGLAVVAVNVAEPAAKVSDFLKKNAYVLPVWLDSNGGAADQYGASAIPTLVVIDRKGTVVEHAMGVHDEASLREMLKKAGL